MYGLKSEATTKIIYETDTEEERWEKVFVRMSGTSLNLCCETSYRISSSGRVFNEKTGKFLKPFMRGSNGGRYPCVDLFHYGRRYRRDLHRLVAEAFLPNPKYKPEVNHLDGDHNNPRANNLEWCTASENAKHRNFMNSIQDFIDEKVFEIQ